MTPPDDLERTFISAIARGHGVAANCRECCEVKKLSDKQLAERFIGHLDQKMTLLRGRLKCDCGNKDLILFLYQAGQMNWRNSSQRLSDMLEIIADHKAELREMAALAAQQAGPPPLTAQSYADAKRR